MSVPVTPKTRDQGAPKEKVQRAPKARRMSVPELTMELLHCRNQLKLFHWQTLGYGAHIALGDAVDSLDEQTDKLLEVAFPADRAGVKSMASERSHGYTNWVSRAATVKYVNDKIARLQGVKDGLKGTPQESVVFILDEIIGGLLRLVYLLKFDTKKRK